MINGKLGWGGYLIFILGLLIFIIIFLRGYEVAPILNTIYLEEECRCCHRYINYMEENGVALRKEYRDEQALESIKEAYGIPKEMWSCHTMLIAGRFFEGHIPIQAISKALEMPNIAGIALPGMPAGSPGMPGTKTQPFRIYAISPEGNISIFMEI